MTAASRRQGKATAETASGTRGNAGDSEVPPQSFGVEAQVAAGAAVGYVRSVAATAATEAELSVAAILAMAAAAIAGLLLLVTVWLCLVAAATLALIAAGLPAATAVLAAAGANLVALLILWAWGRRLTRAIGFPRTRKLVFPGSR